MSSSFKWMPLVGLNLSSANLAAAEKLRKFGFAINCGEFGSEKYTKSALCIYDVLAEKDNPNILIVTQTDELYSWYRMLVTCLGADFKIVTNAPNSVIFFSEFGASLYLISSEALFSENALKHKIPKRFLWNLLIIDEELNPNVPDYEKYERNIIWNAERLMINTQFPMRVSEDKQKLISLVKNVLDSGEQATALESLEFDRTVSRLSENSVVMRYFDTDVYSDNFSRQVEFVNYGFAEDVMVNLRRRMDLRTGLPTYKFGGNVFEQFDCEHFDNERKLYNKPFFTRSDVEDLRLFDRKLDSLLLLCEQVLTDPTARMMIYCCEKNTVDYLHRALICMYKSDVNVTKGGVFPPSDNITDSLMPEDKTADSRIIIGMDNIGTVGDDLDSITCVVNYELPLSPVLLERRMTRHGHTNESRRKFIIFRDVNKTMDSCVLDKVLYLRIADGFCGDLPARNILLDIPEKGSCVNGLVSDLKYIRNYAKQVDNCLDLIKKVKCEYSVPESKSITNAKQLAEFAETMLGRLYTLFGIDENSSESDITAAVNQVSGLCVIEKGRLVKLSDRAIMAASFSDDAYSNLPFAAEAVRGLAEAKKLIDEYHKGEDFHLKIKKEISELGYCIQYPVLFGIWKYRAREQDSNRSFKEYIKIYNDGM